MVNGRWTEENRRRQEDLKNYMHDKLTLKGYNKNTVSRAVNGVIRCGYEYLYELQDVMKESRWWKKHRYIGEKMAELLEKEFKDDPGPMKRLEEDDRVKAIQDVAFWWNDLMPIMLMEECAELQQAISKRERHMAVAQDTWEDNQEQCTLEQKIVAEMADVTISINAYCIWAGIDINDVLKAVDDKLQKEYRK